MSHTLAGTEFYALQKYAVDKFNNQIYASDRNGNNIYLNIGVNEIHEIFARKSNNDIYYAINSKGNFILPVRNGKPYYAFDSFQNPIYPLHVTQGKMYGKYKNTEIYPNNGLTDTYLTDLEGTELYAHSSNGQAYYGSKLINGETVQFYARTKNNENIQIYDENGNVIYLLNITQNKPIYPVKDKTEIYIKINSKEIYGRNNRNLPIYAKTDDDEYFAQDNQQMPYYASYKNTEFYPKMSNKKQFYRKVNNKQIYAFIDINKQYYAKDNHLNDMLALDVDNNYYCTSDKKEIYPSMANKNQYYKLENETEVPALNEEGLYYYAQQSGGESFYPMSFTNETDE